MVFPQLKVFQKLFNSAVVFMPQIFFNLCTNQSELAMVSLSVDFGRLFPKVSASLLVSSPSKERAIIMINYLLTSIARSQCTEKISGLCLGSTDLAFGSV